MNDKTDQITSKQVLRNSSTWSIEKKLYSLMALSIVLIVIGYSIGYKAFESVKVNGEKYKNIVQSKDLVADILPPPEYIIETYLKVLQLTEVKNSEEMNLLFEDCKRLEKEYLERHAVWDRDLVESPMRKSLVITSYVPALAFYKCLKDQFIPLIKDGKNEAAKALALGVMKDYYTIHRHAIDDVVTQATEEIVKAEESAKTEVMIQMGLLKTIGVITLLILFFGSFIINRGILNQLHKVTDGLAEGLGKGNLTIQFDASSKTEIGRISDVLNHTTDHIKTTVLGINKGAESLNTSAIGLTNVSNVMASGLKDASHGIKDAKTAAMGLSSNIETIVCAMEQMTVSIKEIAQSTHNASDIASNASASAKEIHVTIQKLIQNSAEISHIVSTINSLAQQTNLLALNATIEASRAGEQGKGFAVVAQEVKELANKTAKATESIGKQVEGIQTNIKSTTDKISKITEMVKNISDSQNMIASAIEEQTVTTSEIAQNISHVSSQGRQVSESIEMVSSKIQETADQSVKVAGAVVDLNHVSNQLQNQVGAFEL